MGPLGISNSLSTEIMGVITSIIHGQLCPIKVKSDKKMDNIIVE